jgi:hypothetical protein
MNDPHRWQRFGLLVGAAGLAVAAAGLFISREQFFRSYLWAFLFWFSIGMGCLPLLMLHHLVGGRWGFTIRRIIESGTRTLPLMAILFLPVVLGIPYLYEWSHADVVAGSEVLRQKQAYLNVPFWVLRAIVYFTVWLYYVMRLNRLSAAQDATGDPALLRQFRNLSAPGLAVYGLTVTFASFDWAMSLEPQWYSTIYGMHWIVSQALSALALAVIVTFLLSDRPEVAEAAPTSSVHDLGNLLLAFVMLWAYLSFCQLLIVWSGNLPEEIHWYLSRLNNGWQWLAVTLLLFHFVAPFLLLLSRARKRRLHSLAAIAALILVMRLVDTFWIIAPAFSDHGIGFHWLDIFAVLGIGGFWLASYARALTSLPLVARQDLNAVPGAAL